jgi:NTE family protein
MRVNDTLKLIPENIKHSLPLRSIDTMQINPSIDIDHLAHKYFEQMPSAIRLLLKSIGITKTSESSLVSYLLFEKEYCRDLIDAGYNDGLAQKRRLLDFLEVKEVRHRPRQVLALE